MTGGYAIMTFRLKGHCGQTCKTNYDIYGNISNKKMSGGGNQKQYIANEFGKRNYLLRSIKQRNPRNIINKNPFSFVYRCNNN